jgi:hypothetical protein
MSWHLGEVLLRCEALTLLCRVGFAFSISDWASSIKRSEFYSIYFELIKALSAIQGHVGHRLVLMRNFAGF